MNILTKFAITSGVALALAACSGEPAPDARTTKVETVDPVETTKPVVMKPSLERVAALVAEDRRDEALTMARGLVKTMDRTELDQRLDALWNPSSETRNEAAAAVLAEATATEYDEVYSAAYIAGLSYDLGIGVEPDLARVVEFWDHPDVHPVPSAQERLAEIYSDEESDLYDPEKARAARKRAKDAS